MKIFDCFTFFNEVELLKIRLEVLKELDPIHVLVESPTTHTGDPKPLYFKEISNEFRDRKIIHVIADLPNDGDPWHNENEQRRKISAGIPFGDPEDDDLIIVSDLDEIPRPSMIRQFESELMVVAALKMDKFSYYLNCLEGIQTWESARLTSWKYLKTTDPHKLRVGGFKTVMQNAGWHWSWLGGVDKIMEKFYSFAHQESNTAKFANPDIVKHKFDNNISMWGDDYWQIIPVEGIGFTSLLPNGEAREVSFPKYIVDNKESLIEKGLIKKI